MSATIANNPTAKRYAELESNFDWMEANNESQLARMQEMKLVLLECKSNTPIYDWGVVRIDNGEKVVTTASEKIEMLNRRIARFENWIAA